jgi:uncharacterized protein YcbX
MTSKYPLNVQNMSSINAVESAILDPKTTPSNPSYLPDSRRFRANIYVSGPTEFIENDMKRMAIQPAPDVSGSPSEPIFLSLPARCPRCVLPNVDPNTGTRPKLAFPLKYLKAKLAIDKGTESPILGMNAVPWGQAVRRKIKRGDEVIIYRPGEHLYNPHVPKESQTEIW